MFYTEPKIKPEPNRPILMIVSYLAVMTIIPAVLILLTLKILGK